MERPVKSSMKTAHSQRIANVVERCGGYARRASTPRPVRRPTPQGPHLLRRTIPWSRGLNFPTTCSLLRRQPIVSIHLLRPSTAVSERANYLQFAMVACFGSIPMTSPGTSLHADPADLLCPGLSSKDKSLMSVGISPQVKSCKTDFVLYPELTPLSADVIPSPLVTGVQLPDEPN